MKTLRLLFLMLVVATIAKAGGGRYDNIVIDQVGNAVAGATIRVCVAGAINLPCSPTTPIFQDLGLTIPKLNPFNADALGNFFFYAPGGFRYVVQVSGINITTHTLADQFIPDISGGGGGTCDTTNCFVNGGNAFGTALATLGNTNNKDLKVITNNSERFRVTGAGLTSFGSLSTGITIANKGTTGRIAWPDAFIREDENPAGQNVGFGDGGTTNFVFTLLQYPVKPLSFKIFVNFVQKGADNGAGVITGAGISAGTINYSTGAVNVTFVGAPAADIYVSITDIILNNLLVGTTSTHSFLAANNQISTPAIGAEFAVLSYLSLVTPPIAIPANAFFGSIDLYAKDNAVDPVGDKKVYYVDQSGVEKELCTTTGSACGSSVFDPFDVSRAFLVEEFLSGTTSAVPGSIGQDNWWFYTGTTTNGYALEGNNYTDFDRPGQLEVGTGDANVVALNNCGDATNFVRLCFDSAAITGAWRARFFARAFQTDVDTSLFFGLGQGGPVGNIYGANAIGVEKRFADTNWQSNCLNTVWTDSGTAVNTAWHKFEVYTKTPNTTIGISLDSVEIATCDMAAIASPNIIGPTFSVGSNAAADKIEIVDRYDFSMTGLAR